MSIYPFSQQTHRYQGTGVGPVTCSINSSANADFTVGTANWVTGGELISSGAQIGDWIEINVVHPITFEVIQPYILKHFVDPSGNDAMDIRPLAANIPTGFIIRTTYHAVNSGSDRTFCINLDMYEEIS